MNKILERIQAHQTGQRRAVEDLLSIEEDVSKPLALGTLYEYSIDLRLGLRTHCDPQVLGFVKENVRRQVAEYLYGDIRRKLYELEVEIYNTSHPSEKAMELFRELKEETSA